jgi:hypothetical protein
MNLSRCKILKLPSVEDSRGNLAFIEGGKHIQFPIRRVYYLFGVPDGATRGGHGHRELDQLMIATSGSFDVILDDGYQRERIRLSDPTEGLLICPMIWRELENFSANSVCLVLASQPYEESDYFRSYEDFLLEAQRKPDDSLS